MTCLGPILSHNQNVICRVGTFALLAVLATGCSTTHRRDRGDVTLVPEQEPVVVAMEPTPEPHVNIPTPAQRPVAVIPPTVASNLFEPQQTWIALERWSQSNGYGAPRRLATDTSTSFWFASTNGTMGVRVGSQLAYWNGMEYRLGFAPQMIDGHPFVHSLDVRKNFAPLLEDAPAAKTNRVIVIDPGHGGVDIGTTDVINGRFEKEYALDWARRLQALLVTNGWTVFLTRTNDVAMQLSNRVAFAERHKADLFLSLHFNSITDRQQAGLETYCLTPAGMRSHLTRGYADDPSLIYPNNAFDRENMRFAVDLHKSLLKVNGNIDRGVRRARFLGVLQNQNRPAVLVEGGYLSNPNEARRIADPAYRQKLAEALAQALVGDAAPAKAGLVASQSPDTPAETGLERKND